MSGFLPLEDRVTPVTATRSTIPRVWAVFVLAVVLVLGALEGWFGQTDSADVYGSDAVQYLDCARAMGRGDWHSALNPLWSQGYPALLALAHPLFAIGPWGDWLATRAANDAIFMFCCAAFCLLLRELGRLRPWSRTGLIAAAIVFITTQICLDQVSRVGPDQLVSALVFLASAFLLRLGCPMINRAAGKVYRGVSLPATLGLILGIGFLAKAVFLPLGCAFLLTTAILLRHRLRTVLPAVVVFAAIVLTYGVALSKAVGRPTLGEAGSLNYAWHVNRLSKWVHWEGGADSADKAWPKPRIALWTHWNAVPPAFGQPLHPSQAMGPAPVVYVFHEPVTATYIPYYDPAYWYQGYRHLFNWRYQTVALIKNTGDFLQVLLKQPIFYGLLIILSVVWWGRSERGRQRTRIGELWPLFAIATFGIAIYLPVHLEGRYLAPFLALLAVLLLNGVDWQGRRGRVLLAVLLVSFAAGFIKDQRPIWSRALHGWTPRGNVEWRAAEAVIASGLPSGSQIGMVSWTPSLHCDWAYMAGLRITSEIASPADERVFWAQSPEDQSVVLTRFERAGARAVLTWDRPPASATGWQQVGPSPMWMHRF